MEDNSKHITIDLITQYLAGELSGAGKTEVENWISASEGNKKEFDGLKKVWDSLGETHPGISINLDEEWDYLQNKIKPVKQERKPLRLNTFVRVAAAVIIAFGILFMVRDRLMIKTIKTGIAETREVTLPDGSFVTLNAQSKIRYTRNFNNEERQIALSGEAFFEVVKNPDMPFIVSLTDAEIKVLGTSFNVKAYKTMDNVEVTVKEGLVSLYDKNQVQKQVLANAGEKAEYDKKLQVVKKQLNADRNYNAWKTRILIFENDSLQNIVETISNVYHRNITVESPQLNNCTVTTTFENEDFNTVLKVLESTLDIVVETREHDIIITGEGC